MLDLRDRSSRLLVLVVVASVLVGLNVWLARGGGPSQPQDRGAVEAATGARPLDAEAPRVELFNRAEVAVPLESYRGRVVFINFWATWCGPCVAEMASLVALQRTLNPSDIAFVSISEDDSWPPVDAYLRKTPLPFDLFRDRPPRVEDLFKTTAYPTSFLIDREGRLRYRFDGARDWDTAVVRELLALEGVRPVRR